jgi:hypothetical protein
MRSPRALILFYLHAALDVLQCPDPPGFAALPWRQRQGLNLQALLAFCGSAAALRGLLWLTAWQLAVFDAVWLCDLPLRAQVWLAWSAGLWVWPWLFRARYRALSRLLHGTV